MIPNHVEMTTCACGAQMPAKTKKGTPRMLCGPSCKFSRFKTRLPRRNA